MKVRATPEPPRRSAVAVAATEIVTTSILIGALLCRTTLRGVQYTWSRPMVSSSERRTGLPANVPDTDRTVRAEMLCPEPENVVDAVADVATDNGCAGKHADDSRADAGDRDFAGADI